MNRKFGFLAAMILMTAFSASVASACPPCKKLNELAKRSADAKDDEATKIIAQSGFVFQDVIRAQTKLDASSAHDMITVVLNVMEEDEMLTVAENLHVFYKQKRFKPIFDEQLKKFRQKEIDAFNKAMKEVADSEKTDGNG